MNKEKEALLKAILAEPDDVPRKVSMKSILRLLERMQPQTEEMREYLIAYFSAGTYAKSRAIHDAKYATFTPEKASAFSKAYCQCLLNDVGISEDVENESFAPSV
jgi:hypothetical protein